MSDISKHTLQSLRDFIGDALADPDITPTEIAVAIRDELKELIEYHSVSKLQAEKTLSLLDNNNVDLSFTKFVTDDTYENFQDGLTFGGYTDNVKGDFKLDSPYINNNPQWGDDIIDFGNYKNK